MEFNNLHDGILCWQCSTKRSKFSHQFSVVRMIEEEQDLVEFIEEQRPLTTKKTYKTYADAYIQFATDKGLDYNSPVTVASFLKFAALELGLSRMTVCTVIPASISHIFRHSTTPSPVESTIVSEMKKALQQVTEPPGKGRKPLSVEHLRQIVATVSREPKLEKVRNICMVLIMVSGFLRAGEVVRLEANDVTMIPHESGMVLSIVIRKSKTDQGSRGTNVVVSNMNHEPGICPVRWFQEYSKMRNQQARFLFHSLGQKADLTSPLSPSTPNFVVKKLLEESGIDPEGFGSHSCRKGGCSMAINGGSDLRLVMEHGRWKSNAVKHYITDSLQSRLSVSKSALGSH